MVFKSRELFFTSLLAYTKPGVIEAKQKLATNNVASVIKHNTRNIFVLFLLLLKIYILPP
jgi:hypothetical protein